MEGKVAGTNEEEKREQLCIQISIVEAGLGTLMLSRAKTQLIQ